MGFPAKALGHITEMLPYILLQIAVRVKQQNLFTRSLLVAIDNVMAIIQRGPAVQCTYSLT